MGLRHNSVKSENGFTTESDVILPLYSHETYTIKTTFNRNHKFKGFHEGEEHNGSYFAKIHVDENSNPSILKCNGKYYQKFFRKDVLWDFGDGTKVEGYSVEHTYKKPGRYKISCTFFDIDRKAWVNDYSINVIVKEVLPTILRFDKSETKKSINCSKVERIARIEALNSNSVHKNLEVSVERIFTKEQHESNFIEVSKKYDKINDERFGFMVKYWTLLENRQTLFYNSNEVHSDYLEPSDTYQPKYNEIFGKFFYNEYDDKMDILLYQVIPYKNIDDNLKTITILDPNFSILEPDHEVYKTYTINQVYTMNQLPSDVVSIGKRGWFDIFYKNDFVGENNTFSIFYDVEKQNITGELESAPNYLNMNPLGFSINVTHNDTSDIRIGYSLDGFLRPLADDDIAKGEYFIDQHLYNTLFMGIDLDTYLFPYIPFGNNEYYIPKDVQILLSYSVNKINGGNNYSYVNHEDILE
jgi:PKD repeat protein